MSDSRVTTLGPYWKHYAFLRQDLRHLSDAGYRLFCEAYSWSRECGLDGHIPATDLGRLSYTTDPMAAAAELVANGFWVPDRGGDGWRIAHVLHGQETQADLERRREQNRLRKAEQRRRLAEAAALRGELVNAHGQVAKQAAATNGTDRQRSSTSTSTSTSTQRDGTRDVTRDNRVSAGQGGAS
jgi:hypothetical protein